MTAGQNSAISWGCSMPWLYSFLCMVAPFSPAVVACFCGSGKGQVATEDYMQSVELREVRIFSWWSVDWQAQQKDITWRNISYRWNRDTVTWIRKAKKKKISRCPDYRHNPCFWYPLPLFLTCPYVLWCCIVNRTLLATSYLMFLKKKKSQDYIVL